MATPSIPLKRCSKCGVEYPAISDYFRKDKNSKGGLRADCKCCEHEYKQQYHENHREQERKYTRQYHENHREQERKAAQRYREEYPDRYRKAVRQWQKAHPEEVREMDKRRYAKHPEVRREASRRWVAEHPEKHNANNRNREARKYAVPGTHTAAEIAAQLKRQKGRCYYAACGHCKLGNKYHVEHVVPLSRDGSRNDMSNIVISCSPCNLKKGNKLPHEWAEGGRLL